MCARLCRPNVQIALKKKLKREIVHSDAESTAQHFPGSIKCKTKMSLKVNLRHLEEHGIHLKGELPAAELDLGVNDELIRVEKPLRYDLTVELLHDAVLVTGSLALPLECECARCLKKFETELKLAGWALHLPLEGEDKVSVENDCVDLTPFMREDILLDFPQHPLCKPDCAGLKNKDSARKAARPSKNRPRQRGPNWTN